MNIFILDQDFKINANYHPDKLVIKLALESAQMLATVLAQYGGVIHKANGEIYKPTHASHPCTQWAGKSRKNFNWLCSYAMALCDEYAKRYSKEHGCANAILEACLQADLIPDKPSYGFAIAINEQYLDAMLEIGILSAGQLDDIKIGKYVPIGTAVACYRAYLRMAKAHYAEWKYSPVPPFWPRQDGHGRLYCKLTQRNSSNHVKPMLPDSVLAKQEQPSKFDMIWQYNITKCKEAKCSKISKQRLLEAFVKDEDCYAMIDEHIEYKAQPKTKQLSLPEPLALDDANWADLSVENLRNICKAYLSQKVPTRRTISKWCDEFKGEALIARVKEHIIYWS